MRSFLKHGALLFLLLLCPARAAGPPNLKISIVVGGGSSALSLPTVGVRQFYPFTVSAHTGKELKLPASMRDIINPNLHASGGLPCPTMFDPPASGKTSDGISIVTPMTPSQFETFKIGWSFTATADTVPGGIIRLAGSANYRQLDLAQRVFGENTGPIRDPKTGALLSPNFANLPAVLESTTHFQLFARPGQHYKITVRKLGKDVPCYITCDIIK